MMTDTILLALRDTLAALAAEISWRTLVSRTRRCTEAVLAMVLAICASHFSGLPETWWAAICAFSLTGLGFNAALDLGVQQIAGTFAGTVVGVALSRVAGPNVTTFVLSMAIVSAAGLYLATKRSMGYMWILSSALAIFVVTTTHTTPGVDLQGIAEAMWLNALVGTLAYLGVSMLGSATGLLRRKREPAATEDVPVIAHALTDHKLGRVPHTIIGTLTLCVLSYLAWRYPLDGFPQAMTTALVVLMVPVDAQGTWSPYGVVQRMCHRLLGCAVGCVTVLALLPLTTGSLTSCLLAICVLVWIACLLRFGHSNISYVGTQFGAVVILTFVHDGIWLSDNVAVAYHRLVGIAAGNVVLAVTLGVVTVGCAKWISGRPQ